MRPLARFAARSAAVLLVCLCAIWGGLFLWFQAPGGPVASGAAAFLWGVATLAALVAVFRRPRPVLPVFAAVFAGLVLWYAAIQPRNDRDWAADVSRPLLADIQGHEAVIHDVRDFRWTSATEGRPRWEERRYDLDAIESVDLINSYWMGPTIAHTLVSFGFRDGSHVAFSAEIRPEKGEDFSALAGFFKRYELVFVAADERDIVAVRTDRRHEDVQLYRLKASQEQIRKGFVDILRRAGEISDHPVFYGTLDRNCTTVMFGAARAVAPGLPFDWRVILSGYLPDYAYEHGLLDTRYSLEALRERGRIAARAIAAGDAPDFSARIRTGVPDPNR